MTGYGMSIGCNCCGCQILEHRFFPDFYDPVEVVCFVRRRERITIATLTQQTSRTWVDGIGTNNTATLVNTTETTDETIDTVTTLNHAGQFEWAFPTVTIPFPAQVLESEVGEMEVNGTRTFRPRTRTITTKTVWEEYRLVMRFDVSEQFNFERLDALGARIIKAANVQVVADQYTITGWPVGVARGQTNEVAMRGFMADADMPETRDEFHQAWQSLSSNNLTQFFGNRANNVLPWLPQVPTQNLYVMFYSDTAKRGLTITGAKLSIWDRPQTNTAYDWQKDWIREGLGKWRSLSTMPTDNYQFSLESLLPIPFWAPQGRKLIVTLFSLDLVEDEEIETVLMQQTFEVEAATQPASFMGQVLMPLRWPITLISNGSFGRVPHLSDSSSTAPYPITRPVGFGQLFPSFGPLFKVRGSVIEMKAPRRDEDGLDVRYEFIPFWHGAESLPPHYLRIELVADYPQVNLYSETGLPHFDDQSKMTCPGNYTCSVIDDYAHPEWRIISHTFPALKDSRTPTRIDYLACEAIGGPLAMRFTPFTVNGSLTVVDDDSEGVYVHVSEFYGTRYLLVSPDYGGGPNSHTELKSYYMRTGAADETVVDLSNNSDWNAKITIRRGYATVTSIGIPNENTPIPRPAHLGWPVLVASGRGQGLLFAIDGVHTFFPNVNPAFASAKFTFVYHGQAYVPELQAIPTEEDRTAILASLGSGSYWFLVDGLYYRLDASGMSEGLEECGIDPPELVDVVVTYTPRFRRNAAVDASDEDEVELFASSVQGDTSGNSDTITTDPTTSLGDHSYPATVSLANGIRIGTSVPPVFEIIQYDLIEVRRRQRTSVGTIYLTNTDHAQTQPITLVKRVPRWKDRELPTLTFSGGDAPTPFNYATGVFEQVKLRKIDSVKAELVNAEYENFSRMEAYVTETFGNLFFTTALTARRRAERTFAEMAGYIALMASVTTLDLNDLALTIGPSDYVPPEPP